MNKGLEIRNKKRKKASQVRGQIKENQEDLFRYVTYSDKTLLKTENNKWSSNNFEIERGEGIQFENKIYLANGKFKYVNRSTLRLKEKIDFNDEVISKLNKELKKIYYEKLEILNSRAKK